MTAPQCPHGVTTSLCGVCIHDRVSASQTRRVLILPLLAVVALGKLVGAGAVDLLVVLRLRRRGSMRETWWR